jgi:hypothetical protein
LFHAYKVIISFEKEIIKVADQKFRLIALEIPFCKVCIVTKSRFRNDPKAAL